MRATSGPAHKLYSVRVDVDAAARLDRLAAALTQQSGAQFLAALVENAAPYIDRVLLRLDHDGPDALPPLARYIATLLLPDEQARMGRDVE